MYKEKISACISRRTKQEMLDDICTLCSINSEQMPAYQEGDAVRRLVRAAHLAHGTQNGGRAMDFPSTIMMIM